MRRLVGGYRYYFDDLDAPELQYSHNGKYLAVAANYGFANNMNTDGTIHFYDVENGFQRLNQLSIVDPNEGMINSFDFSPTSYFLYYISNNYDPIQQENVVFLNRSNLINGQVENISGSNRANPESQIRRFRNGKMYLAGYSDNVLNVFSNPDGAFIASTITAFNSSSKYKLQATLHTNSPVKITKIADPLFIDISRRYLEKKVYEITDHLGNVRTVVSDRKNSVITAGEPGEFTPDLISGTNYYPFGAIMPGRSYNADSYRYGFIGAENDNEISGNGNSQNHLFRSYDPRLGRYKSLDPLAKNFAALSPFSYSGNSPIAAFDLEGLEPATVNPNTETLIIVLQGYGGDPQDGKTQAQNAGGGLGVDATGLGQIAAAAEGSTKIQVVAFASSTTGNTKEDVKLTLYRHYANTEGKGRVVVVGHSQGADNAVELFGGNSELSADLLILLDIKDASNKGIFSIDDDNIGSNVKNVINYYQTGEFIGGEQIDIEDNTKTNGANILSPGSNHRSIDNDLVPFIMKDINNLIEGKIPVNEATRRTLPTFNPSSTGSPDITGGSKSTAGGSSGF